MTVANETNRSGPYTGNGVTTAFNYEFRILDEAHIRVTRAQTDTGVETVLELNTDYSVSGVGVEGGGEITLTVAPTSIQTVTFLRNVPFTQETDLENQGAFFAETIEDALDQSVMRDQQLSERIDRVLKFSESDPPISGDLPPVAARKNKLLGFDGDGNPVFVFAPEFVSATIIDAALVSTRTVAELTVFDANVLYLVTGGATAVGDGGQKNYQRGTGAGAFVDAGGVSWVPIGSGGLATPITPQGRLSVTDGVAATATDVTAAASIYWVPAGGVYVPVFGGLSFVNMNTGGQLTHALSSNPAHTNYHQAGKNFDEFVIVDAGTVRLGSGPSWNAGAVAGSDDARGTGAGSTELELFDGVWVNKNAIVIRFGSADVDTVAVAARQATYVGSFRTIAAGQTEDSAAKRWLYNAYNQTMRLLRNAIETTNTWDYTTATFRQANNNPANQLDVLVGLPGNLLDAEVYALASNTSGNIFTVAGIGIDLTNTNAATAITPSTFTTANSKVALLAKYQGYLALGRRTIKWLEYSTATGTTSWYGDNGQPDKTQCGISGTMLM